MLKNILWSLEATKQQLKNHIGFRGSGETSTKSAMISIACSLFDGFDLCICKNKVKIIDFVPE
jgi:hypothetical protein